jgi:hypothetical protein
MTRCACWLVLNEFKRSQVPGDDCLNFRRFRAQRVVFKGVYFRTDPSLVYFQISMFK